MNYPLKLTLIRLTDVKIKLSLYSVSNYVFLDFVQYRCKLNRKMWQRFTERARKVVFYAHEEAQKFGEGYVSTEHLLLGLIREEDGVGARVLKHIGLPVKLIKEEVEKQLPRGDARPSSDMTLAPRAKRVIDLAYDEARNLNSDCIGTEHLLLGLIREGDGLAGRVLAKLGVELERCRRLVMELQDNERKTTDRPRYEKMIRPPFSPELRHVLYNAQAFAQESGQTKVKILHVLRCMISTTHCEARARILAARVDIEALDSRLAQLETPSSPVLTNIDFESTLGSAFDDAKILAEKDCAKETTSIHLLVALMQRPDFAAMSALSWFKLDPAVLSGQDLAPDPATVDSDEKLPGNLPEDEPR